MATVTEQRGERLRKVFAESSLDGLLVTNLTNVRYLSGFTGSAGTCLFLDGAGYFVSDGRYLLQSKEQVKGMEIFIGPETHLEIITKKGVIREGLALGFESEHTTVAQFEQMKAHFPGVQWKPTEKMVEKLACVKDPSELRALRRAVEITDAVYEQIVPEVRAGATEKEIAAKISYLIKMLGGEGDAFSPIVAGGPNSALPHAQPSDRPFQRGDFIVLDFGAKYAGYHGDMTRTVVLGEASEKQKEIYQAVLEAQVKGCEAARPGIACRALDSVCRDHISSKGFGDYFVHGTGHGLGLEIHTMPRFSQLSDDFVHEHYVMTVEPGIYIPDFGGVRIEDDIVITADGAEVLNRSPKHLQVIE